MPTPKPQTDESQEEFMSRCVSFMSGEGKPNDQAVAICMGQWEGKKKMVEKHENTEKKEPASLHTGWREVGQDSVAAGKYPSFDDVELPEHLRPRHKKTPREMLEEELKLP